MVDSALVTKWMPAYAGNYTKNRAAQGGSITEITVHHCAGSPTVDALGRLWQSASRKGSSHYGVCGNAVGQYVPECDVAWTNSNWAANCRAVTIEVSNSGGEPNWPVSDASLQTLAQLMADIARRNGLGDLCVGKNLTYHSMYTATACPGPYLRAKLPEVAAQANAINRAWQEQHATANTQAAPPLSADPCELCVGPASSGDRAALRALAESLCLGYEEDETGRVRIGPASAGDQSTVLTKAAALGLEYGVYEPEAASGAQPGAAAEAEAARLAQLLAEQTAKLEELRRQCGDAQAAAEKAAQALAAAEAKAEGYLQKINAAKAALEG